MNTTTLGQRVSTLRKSKGIKQDELAEMLSVSPQAVSKWENDQTCPDISLLPKLSKILGVSVDDLLVGKVEEQNALKIVPIEERKDINEMLVKIVVDSADGDKVRVNLPVALIKIALEMGIEMPQVSGNQALKNIDFAKIIELIQHGVMGNLVEVESADGDIVRIFVD